MDRPVTVAFFCMFFAILATALLTKTSVCIPDDGSILNRKKRGRYQMVGFISLLIGGLLFYALVKDEPAVQAVMGKAASGLNAATTKITKGN